MTVDRREVERVAGLARLPLEPAEADRLRDEMNRILEHADRLMDAAAGAEPGRETTAREPDFESGVRAAGVDAPDVLLHGIESFAPALEAGFFLVPPPQGVTAEEQE